jgi:hypothetical protein
MPASLLRRLICRLRFHDLYVVHEFGGSRKLHCRRCNSYFGMHDEFRAFVPWDEELESMYRIVYGVQRTNLGWRKARRLV